MTRRLTVPVLLGCLLAGIAGVGSADASGTTTSCPPAETLVSGTTWHRATLGSGVSLSEGRHSDPRGYVDMHVLRVSTTTTGVHVGPLVRHFAERHPLSTLAASRPHLVAATNTGYYDFTLGTPTGPVISAGHPFVMSTAPQGVVGLAAGNLVQGGRVWLAGTVTAGAAHLALAGLNLAAVPSGITVYTPSWGTLHKVVLPSGAVSRYVASGRLSSLAGAYTAVPTTGYLVVARGSTAVAWLKRPAKGTAFSYTASVRTDAPKPFVQAYGVGVTLVSQAGVARTDFPCRASYPQPARTAVGYLNGGKTLVIVVVADHPGTSMHGLDQNQMSSLMVQLGVTRAYSFDGSGSAELMAHMPGTTGLSIRNYTADGHERTMPLGLGIYVG